MRWLSFRLLTMAAMAAMASALSGAEVLARNPVPELAAAPPEMNRQTLVGRDVFASDQIRIGKVESVQDGPNGKVVAIHVKTGGFLGFGAKTVAIPDGTFSMRGLVVQLQLSSEQVQKLPELKNGT